MVTLTATAADGSVFTGWSGGGCSETGTCVVTMSSNQAVTGTFVPTHVLTVSLSGAGAGSVAASGIGCLGVCSDAYPQGTVVSLNATSSPRSVFAGWSGACTGTGACLVTMSSDQAVTATFVRAPVLKVSLAGSGAGNVAASGISCPGVCSDTHQKGTTVALTATAASGSVFTGWSGGGCSGTGTCVVTMSSDSGRHGHVRIDPCADAVAGRRRRGERRGVRRRLSGRVLQSLPARNGGVAQRRPLPRLGVRRLDWGMLGYG
jgi:hypothetical protein